MYVPLRSAASITSSPGLASIGLPLTVTSTVSEGAWTSDTGHLVRLGHVGLAADRHRRLGGATAVGDELVAEPHDRGRDRGHGARPERADRGLPRRPGDAGADVVADVEQQGDVVRSAMPVEDPTQHLLEPGGALAARRALAARLAREEPDHAPARLHGIG